jgi:signal transduction histidine kinase
VSEANLDSMGERRRSPLLAASFTGLAVLVALIVIGALGALLHIRSEVTRASDELRRDAGASDLPARPAPAEIQAFLAGFQVPARLIGRFGQDVAATGPATGFWDRPGPDWTGRLATVGLSERLLDGAVEVRRPLANNRAVVLRRDVGVTSIDGATAIMGGLAALVVALIAAAAVFVRERRRSEQLSRLIGAAEAVASGRQPGEIPVDGEFARVGVALRTIMERLTHLGEIADRELALLAAAIEPLPVGVAGRGPSGGRLRNLALERLIDGLPANDRAAVEAAIQDGLDAAGPVGTRVSLTDGRAIEVDAWTVPGGRLASVAERTEQERLANLRRQLEGSAVRQLRAPIDEIKSRGKELYKQVPAPAAPTLRAIFAATDRLDRVVRMLLRGTPHDPALRPPRRETFGVAGLLWGLAHEWDAALRKRALRVEIDIATDLPDVRTDPALVEEVLTELVDNAAKFAPRGGTVALAVRAAEGAVLIEVTDTGPGLSPEDAPYASERFFRGQHSESIPGAGLGLGVASALASRLGGRLVAEPGPGGRVRLEIPVARPVAPALSGVPD